MSITVVEVLIQIVVDIRIQILSFMQKNAISIVGLYFSQFPSLFFCVMIYKLQVEGRSEVL